MWRVHQEPHCSLAPLAALYKPTVFTLFLHGRTPSPPDPSSGSNPGDGACLKINILYLIKFDSLIFSFKAGPPGFEPGSSVLETEILPLNYRPFFQSKKTLLLYKKRRTLRIQRLFFCFFKENVLPHLWIVFFKLKLPFY